MRKITPQQEEQMRSMCMERKSNQEIADTVGLHITAVYAWRSRNNLTRKKVEKLLSEQHCQSLLEYCNTVNHDKALLSILDSCEWSLDKVVSFIVSVLDSNHLCRHCPVWNDTPACADDCSLNTCGVAAIKCIRERTEKKS